MATPLFRSPTPTSTTTPYPRIPSASEYPSYYGPPNATHGPLPTDVPTWTPQPSPWGSEGYTLTDWTPAKAQALIETLTEFPDTLNYQQLGYLGMGYDFAFKFAALAEAEAFSRFPGATEAEQWKYAALFHGLLSLDPTPGQTYATLIVDALNGGETNLDGLEEWFDSVASPLRLERIHLDPLPGYSASQILFVNPWDAGLNGGMYIWLVRKGSVFETFPLASDMETYYSDGDVSLELADVTGDGIPEAIVRHLDYGSFHWHSGTLDVFDLSQAPPTKLTFNPVPDSIEIANWSAVPDGLGYHGIALQIPFYVESPGCGDFGPTWMYRWNGTGFELEDMKGPSHDEMAADPRCTNGWMANSLLWLASEGNQPAAVLLESLIGAYDPSLTDLSDIPQDELRYEFALDLAFYGRVDEARGQMESILDEASGQESAVVDHAHAFLTVFHSQDDLLDACLQVGDCHIALDIPQLMKVLTPTSVDRSIRMLESLGVDIRYSGRYDFGRDGQSEGWLIDYHPDWSYGGLWLLSLRGGNVVAEHVATVAQDDLTQSSRMIFLGRQGEFYEYQLSDPGVPPTQDGFIYWDQDKSPNVIEHPMPSLWTIWSGLLNGQISPTSALTQLADLRDRAVPCPQWMTEKYGCESDQIFLYVQGLAYELGGNRDEAARAYRSLWQIDSQSPYAIMARAKLDIDQ